MISGMTLNSRKLTRWSVALVSILLLSVQCVVAQKPDRTAPPKPGPTPEFHMGGIDHMTLANGLRVVFVEKHQVPLVQMNLIVRAGSLNDPEGKLGLASMTSTLMMDGAGGRDALQLADAIDYLGARIGVAAGQHTFGVTLHTPVSKLDSALTLFADVILRPAFNKSDLERRKKERLTTLLQWRDEPRALATVAFNSTLYTSKHPYGENTIGTEESIRSFTDSDLRSFHAGWFRPNNATLIVVGDISGNGLRMRLANLFSQWEKGPIPQTTTPPIGQVKERQVYLVDKPGAAQSEIRIGCVGVPRTTQDYFPLVVMNTILGGSFSSRLNQNLRELHGYTYGAGSMFDFRPLAGPFRAYAAVQTAKTDSALIEFMAELTAIREPVSDVELERAKNYVALSYPADFQSIASVAVQLEDLVIYGLPDDYIDNYTKRILAVTKDDVVRVAKTYLDPKKMAIIVVGDKKEIQAGIEALHLGPWHEYTIDQLLGKAPTLQ